MQPARPVPQFTISDAVAYSWGAAWRHFRRIMAVSLVVFTGNVVLVSASAAVATPGMQAAFTVLGVLLNFALVLGLIRASLEVVQGRSLGLADAFRPEGLGSYLIASALFVAGVYLGSLLLIVPAFVFAAVFEFYGYVVAEHPDVPALVALRHSAQITRGSRLRLVGLGIVLAFLNLAGIFFFVVGLVVTYAITTITLAYVYRHLTGQPVATL